MIANDCWRHRVATSLNCDGRYGQALLGAMVLVTFSELGGELWRVALRFDRVGIANFEFWRLVTGHFVHLDALHSALNALGLILMWALFARDYTPARWIVIVGTAILAIDAGLWFIDRDLTWYVGASGWLHGVLAAGTLAHLRRGDIDGWILAAFLAIKLTTETLGVHMPFAGSASVIERAHLYGAIGGLLAAFWLPSRREPL